MVQFDSTTFGSVTINGKKFGDVLVVDEQVIPREKDSLRKIFGTSHAISGEELKKLLKGDPQAVIIGTGQSGMLKVDDQIRSSIEEAGAELLVLRTPQAIAKYNELSMFKIVNALIHTTC